MYISAVHTQRKRKRTRCPHWDCTRGPKAVGAILSTYRADEMGGWQEYDRIWQCLGRLWWLRSTPRCCSTQLFQNHYFLLEALCSAFGFSIHPWNSFLAVYVFSPNFLLFRDGLPVWTCFTICPTLGSVYASAIISLSCVMDLLYPAIPDHLFASGHWKIMLIWPGVNLQIRTTFWHCGLKPECAELSRPEVSRKICKFSWAAALDCILNHIKSC